MAEYLVFAPYTDDGPTRLEDGDMAGLSYVGSVEADGSTAAIMAAALERTGDEGQWLAVRRDAIGTLDVNYVCRPEFG